MSSGDTAYRTPSRSYLFVPGDRPERFAKAWESSADEIILDLEDAVAEDNKAAARTAIGEWIDPDRPIWIRINSIEDPGFAEDIALSLRLGVKGVFFPKAQSIPVDLIQKSLEQGLQLVPIVESAAGMHCVETLARTPGVARLAFGSLDFMVDLDIDEDVDDTLLYFRSRLVLASKLGGLPAPIDGITTRVDDAELILLEAERSRRLGFGAKLCIHPNQLQHVHEAFAPKAEDRRWADRVLAAYAGANGAAVALDGRMIDRPVWLKAQRIHRAPGASVRLRG